MSHKDLPLSEAIRNLLTGIGVFMIGISTLCDGLSHGASKILKKVMNKISSNRFLGIAVGTIFTAISQSSAATTVMVVTFVNSGIMNLFQAASIIIGANIGTTISGVIVALSTFKFSLYTKSLTFITIINPFFLKKHEQAIKEISNIFIGLGMIFVGLDMMGHSLRNSQKIKNYFINVFSKVNFPLLLIFIGIVVTALIQSSAGATGIVITLVGEGVLKPLSALFIIIGSNVGTCATALIASIGTKESAIRSSMIHLLFNLCGMVFFTSFIWPFPNIIINILNFISPSASLQIAYFHIIFNVFTAIILLPFISFMTKVVTLIIKDKYYYPVENKSELQVSLLDEKVSFQEIIDKILSLATTSRDILMKGFNTVCYRDLSESETIYKEKENINEQIDEIISILIQESHQLNQENNENLNEIVYHFERISSYAVIFLKRAEEMKELKLTFSDKAKEELGSIYKNIISMYIIIFTFLKRRNFNELYKMVNLLNEVNELKEQFKNNQVLRLYAESCSIEKGIHFLAIINDLKRISHHLLNASYAFRNYTKDEENSESLIINSMN